ncbi:hypothetical protein ACGFYO_14900 [Streptomyces sp. NPDC048201]|uniref:hypothetical protein n=1 Tax=Streptomyces sp. NPDC048201 TaxID=3365513 RepID=UPI003722654B
MGVLFGYFTAADDAEAARAVVRDDDQAAATGHDGFDVNAMDPTSDLVPAEALLTGRSAEAVRTDPRNGHLIAMTDDGQRMCLSLTDTLRDALAEADRASLRRIALEWAASDAFPSPPDPDGLAEFLDRAADLSRGALARGHRLYCWISV